MLGAAKVARWICTGAGLFFVLPAFAAAPTVAITNIVVASNHVLTIYASASDSDGSVTNVEFYAQAVEPPWNWPLTRIGETNAQPYRLTWQAADQRYNIKAVAIDNAGLRATSIMWQVCATVVPVATLLFASNQIFASGSPISFHISVDYVERPIQYVSYSWSSSGSVTSTQAPFSGTWSNSVPGRYQLSANVNADCVAGWANPRGVPFTVLAADGTPMIVSEPGSRTVAPGATTTFTVDALALASSVHYQWRHFGTNVPDATNATLVIANVQAADAGPYSVSVTTEAGTVSSSTAWLTVTGPGVSVQFSGGPIQAPGWAGPGPMGSAFRAELWAGPSPYELAPIGSSVVMNNGYFNGGTRVVTTVSAPQPVYCQVRFRLTSGGGVDSSLQAYPTPTTALSNLFVPGYLEWPDPNLFFNGSSNLVAPANADFSFLQPASSRYLTTYQWRRDGMPFGPAILIAGPATNSSLWWTSTNVALSLANVQESDAAEYTLWGSNSVNVSVSEGLRLSVVNRPVLQQQPGSRVVFVGASLQLHVLAAGAPLLTYQWRRDGTNVPGANEATYVVDTVSTADAGAYDVVVQNSVAAVTSVVAQVTVISFPAITNQPTNRTVVAGNSVSFQVGALGPDPTYYWRRNGALLPDETQPVLTIAGARPEHAASYTVVVSNQYGFVTSTTAALTVVSAINPSPENIVPYGTRVTFYAVVHGPLERAEWRRIDSPAFLLGVGPSHTVLNANPSKVNGLEVMVNYQARMSTPPVTVVSNLVLSAPLLRTNGDLTFQILSGNLATQLVVQACDDLGTWVPVATVSATNGAAAFVQPAGSNAVPRFFRALASPP